MTTATKTKVKWNLKGEVISGCNCDWGCPCNFDAPPTYGGCNGVYAFHIKEGSSNNTKLDGLTIGFAASTPAAVHLGNMTAYLILDERATPQQREALGTILSGKVGGPFAVFAGLITKLIGPEFLPVEWKLAGPKSYVRFGDRIEVKLDSIKNPVSGKPAGFTLRFTDGLLTKESKPMATSVFRVSHPQLSFSHPGKYGQTFKFDYAGEG